ncbi:MAG: sugar kinase [Eubacteriales bacterium]|jgi:2-dehydro-3-deoxygluconokinase
MNLNLRKKENCKYDAVSIGEIMLRLDPGDSRIRTARNFRVWEGGAEYNSIRGLHKCFGLRTAAITAFADNEVGRLLTDLIEQGGVSTEFIRYEPTDGIGRLCRNGINFCERGFGLRGGVGCPDRYNSAISKMKPDDFDFDYIFGTLGVRWLHTGGIYAALSENSAETIVKCIETAKKYGTVVSYDLNYRPSLWEAIGGTEKCQEVNRRIADMADVLVGCEEDFSTCLGFQTEGTGDDFSHLDAKAYGKMIRQVAEAYPSVQMVVCMLDTVTTASLNDWQVVCYTDGQLYQTRKYENLEIYDRLGFGDAFSSGMIYGLIKTEDPQKAIEYGAASGALAVTTPGDNTMASVEEVEALMANGDARVKR